jgi:hypothetical protein
MPLFEITRQLTRPDDRFDRAAILRAAWAEMSIVPGLDLAQALRRRWRAARFERDTNRDFARRNGAHAAATQAAEADARQLAAQFDDDVERLRIEVERWRYCRSTARVVELPRFEAALRLARDLAARQTQRSAGEAGASASGNRCVERNDEARDAPRGVDAPEPAVAGQAPASMAQEYDTAGGAHAQSRRSSPLRSA